MKEIITVSILFLIAVAAFVLCICSFLGKGFPLNIAYLYASMQEREAMNTKLYYRQSAIVFLLIGCVFALNGCAVLFCMGWISYIAIAVVISTMVYAIISSVAIKKQKKANISRIVFGIYFVLLTWLVLFKFTTSLSELPSIRGINLIPFYYDQETSTHLSEVFYNMLVFVPLGVYIQIFRDNWKITSKCLVILLISFLFEVIQFVFAIGTSDITDLIGNTLGGLIGIVFCIVMSKISPKKYIAIINVLGGIIEIAFTAMMVLLLVANR